MTRMKSLSDIEIVLRQTHSPLSAPTIVEHLTAKGLWQSTAIDPAASIVGLIASDMKKDDSPFVKSGNGTYGVRPSAKNVYPVEPNSEKTQFSEMRNLSYCDAAVEVLRRHGKPMHGGTIRDEMIAQALIKSDKCPTVRTVVGVISDEANGIKGKHRDNPRLQSTSMGCYGLAEWKMISKATSPAKEQPR